MSRNMEIEIDGLKKCRYGTQFKNDRIYTLKLVHGNEECT